MRSTTFTTTTLTALLSSLLSATATPYLPLVDFARSSHRNGSLELRDCANPCGWENLYCCQSDETCTTSANVALCAAGSSPQTAAPGNYQPFTTTFVEFESTTVTSTGSYLISPQTPVASPGLGCASGEQACGTICCSYDQVCGSVGQCVAATSGYVTASVSQTAAVRATSNTVATITSAATTTVPFSAPVNSAGAGITASPQNTGLSAGAIAGIVIGVLIGLFILFFVLACLCCKGIIDGLLALFGFGKKRRRVEETTIIESRHSHHGSSRPAVMQRTWWGGQRPVRSSVVVEEKKRSGMGLLGVGGLLAGLAVLLGLKRRHDRKAEEQKFESEYTASYYSYDDDYSTSQSE